jgi:hypothetical protein
MTTTVVSWTTLLRIACFQGAAYFVVSLGYLALSRLLIAETWVLDFAYICLTTSGLLMVVQQGGGWRGTLALALGGATGGAVAIMLALLAGFS